MSVLKSVCLTLWLCMPFYFTAQMTDSSHLLKTVEIKSFKNNFARQNYLQEVFTANSLQSQFSDLYIKSYGLGQLSTLSVRGMSAENTAILWENIPINSAMNGLYDLNLTPNAISQNFSYQIDQNRLTTGGSFLLSQNSSNKSFLALSTTDYLSSLYSHKVEGNYAFAKGNISMVTNYTHGVNNYEYFDGAGIRKKLANNNQELLNTQLFFNHAITKKWQFNAGFWLVNLQRNIPESEYYPNSIQNLTDKNYRGYIGVKHANFEFKLAYFNEDERYEDKTFPAFSFISTHKVQSYKGVLKYQKEFNHQWGIQYILYPSHYVIESSTFADKQTINEAIQQMNLHLHIDKKWLLEGGIKSQVNTNFSHHFLPFLSATYKATNKLQVSLIGDINQRNPTANQLYYNDPYAIGNINLKPELNYQIRNVWKYSIRNYWDKVQLNVEPYYLYSIDNHKWLETVPGSYIYSVYNVAKVKNLGINSNVEWLRRIAGSNFLRTIVSVNYIDSKDGDGNLVPYVPNFKTIISLNWITPTYEILIQNNYTSRRTTTLTGTNTLKPYFLTNLKATYKLPLKNSQMNFSLGVDNTWNESYQEVQGNFLPLRNYYLSWTAILQ